MMIQTIVNSYGLTITSTGANNTICAITTLERIYDKYGHSVLDRTIRLAVATWEGEDHSLSGGILMGIAKIIVAYGDALKEDLFKERVGRQSVKSIIRTAREWRPGAMGFAEAMMLAYNSKSKNKLSMRILYGGNPAEVDGDEGEDENIN